MKTRQLVRNRSSKPRISLPVLNAKKPRLRIDKIDPSRTFTLRRSFAAKIKKRFGLLRGKIIKLILVDDVFGMARKAMLLGNAVTTNAPPYAFKTDPEKVRLFQEWLKEQFKTLLVGKTEAELWEAYARDGFRRGAGRAFEDVNGPKKFSTKPGAFDFYAGGKEQFLRSAFGKPENVDKVKLLAGRSFNDLKNLTEDMQTKMSRVLTDGLVRGAGPMEVARELSKTIDIGTKRAEVISRTEIMRAHAEGQISAFKELGIEEVGAAVEWSTAGDDRVCPRCAPMEGVVLKLEEARGMLPLHPQCRCTWIPALVGENDKNQITDKSTIDARMMEAGIEKEADEDRPVGLIPPMRNELVDIDLLQFEKLRERPITLTLHGGPGSGNFGHDGRPGEVGGSAPAGSGGGYSDDINSLVTESSSIHDGEYDHAKYSDFKWTHDGEEDAGVDLFRKEFKKNLTDRDEWASKVVKLTGANPDDYEEQKATLITAAEEYKDKLQSAADAYIELKPHDAEIEVLKLAELDVADYGYRPKGDASEWKAKRAEAIKQAREKRKEEIETARKNAEPFRQAYISARKEAKAASQALAKADADLIKWVEGLVPTENSKLLTLHGGPGSGNFGHAGRPGEVGGSAPEGSGGGSSEESSSDAPSGLKTTASNFKESSATAKVRESLHQAKRRVGLAKERLSDPKIPWDQARKELEDAKAEEKAAFETYSRESRLDLQAHLLREGDGNRIPISTEYGTKWTQEEYDKINDVGRFFGDTLAKSHGEIPTVIYGRVKDGSRRAYYELSTVHVGRKDDAGTYAHEIGHHLEHHIPGAKEAAAKFLADRTAGEGLTSLKDKFPGHGFEAGEMGKQDDFGKLFPDRPADAYYVGKSYNDGKTEIISMGVELLHRDPHHFAKTDPEYFNLITGILQNKHRKGD